jgi:hypothetical protein
MSRIPSSTDQWIDACFGDHYQSDNEPILGQYFGIQCSGLKALVSLAVHALWPSWESRRHAWLSAKPHANFIGPAQGSVVAIFALRSIGEPITVTAKEICSGSIELGHAAAASDSIDDARTDEIRPGTA